MRKINFTVLGVLCAFGAIGQDQPTPEKNYFVSDESKLFWQGDQPLYVFVANNPEGKNPKRMESESSKDFTNPMFLDTEGINFLRSNWAFKDGAYPAGPRREILFELYKDTEPPVTKSSFSGAPYYRGSDQNFYGKGLTVALSSKDELSGVAKTYASVDNKAYASYSDAFSFTSDQSYIFKYLSQDNVGNLESESTETFYVDVTAPSSSHVVEGDKYQNVLSPRSKIILTSQDKSSGVKQTIFQFDERSEFTYSSKLNLNSFDDGPHSLSYYSVDQVANEEEENKYEFYLDKIAPEITGSIEGPSHEINGKLYASGKSKLTLTATDNKAEVKSLEYQYRNEEKKSYVKPIGLPQQNGIPSIQFFTSDNVNNQSVKSFEEINEGNNTLVVDVTAPVISHSFTGLKHFTRDTLFITSETKIYLKATDLGAGVKKITYTANSGNETQYSSPFTLNEEGIFRVSYNAVDNVDNKEIADFVVVVDNTGPIIENVLSMETIGSIKLDEFDDSLPVFTKKTKFYLGATDGVIAAKTIYYRLNDEREVRYQTPIVVSKSGVNTIVVRAIDDLMNETVSDPITVFIN